MSGMEITTDVSDKMSEDSEWTLPFPARTNRLTADIDVNDSKAFVQQLYQCFFEVFTGWGSYQGLCGGPANAGMRKVAATVAQIIQSGHRDDLVLVAGVGPAGRVAYDVVRIMNRHLETYYKKRARFEYISAGGEYSLRPDADMVRTYCLDDSAKKGVKDLQAVCRGSGHVLYIGLDFELSSAYIAGQLDMCIKERNQFTPVLVTNINTEQASQAKLDGVNFTVHDVVRRLEAMATHEHAFILSPIYGPEPLAGALDMKHGTGAYILLVSIFLLANLKLENQENKLISSAWPIVGACRRQLDELFKQQENNMADLVHDVTHAVSNGGQVYYMGEDDLGTMAVLTTAESAYNYSSNTVECPMSTLFSGGRRGSVLSFVSAGDEKLSVIGEAADENKTAAISSDNEEVFNFRVDTGANQKRDSVVSREHTSAQNLQGFGREDIVILLVSNLDTIPEHLTKLGVGIVVINFIGTNAKKLRLSVIAQCKSVIQFTVHGLEPQARKTELFDKLAGVFLKQVACRLVCHVIETASHIKLGRTYRNYLVDFTIGNNVSFHRAVSYLQRLADVSEDEAREILLKAVHEKNQVASDVFKPMHEHVEKALDTPHVLLTAAYFALAKRDDIVEAAQHVRQCPNLTKLLKI